MQKETLIKYTHCINFALQRCCIVAVCFTLFMTRLHLRHTIEMTFRAHEVDVITFTSAMEDFVWCLYSSQSWLVRLSTQDEALDVAQSASQGAHNHADVTYFLPSLEIKKGARIFLFLRVEVVNCPSHQQDFGPSRDFKVEPLAWQVKF